MKVKNLPAPHELTRYRWTAKYELPSGEHKRMEAVAQCTSAEECTRIVERIIKKIGGPNAILRIVAIEPVDKTKVSLPKDIPAILLPLPLPLDKTKTKDETEALNKEFASLSCFIELNTKITEDGLYHPFYKALPKDVA